MKKLIKQYYIHFTIIIALILLVIFVPFSEDTTKITFEPIDKEDNKTLPVYIYIDVKGQVENPGVYKLLVDSRLFQLITLAGGTTEEADTLAINLSLKLYDQQVIYIPSFSDDFPIISDVIEDDISKVININSASLELLDTLPGIGPSTAQSIIDYRNENGFFQNIEDIMNVSGIGENTFNEIKNLITV